MNKKLSILLLLGLFIFCISFVSAAVTTTLNSPADDSIAYVNPVTFNASAEVTGGATLVNMSLWTNESGSWEIKNTSDLIPKSPTYSGFNFNTRTSSNPFVAWNGSSIFVQEGNRVSEYNTTGTWTGFDFVTNAETTSSQGLTWDGTYFWILSFTDEEVYAYDSSGSYASLSFDTSTTARVFDITWDGTYLWLVSDSEDVYKYYVNGTYTGDTFDVSTEMSTARAIAYDGSELWIVEETVGGKTYEYYTNGTYTGNSFTSGDQSSSMSSIAYNGDGFYTSDFTADNIWRYDFPFLSSSTQTFLQTITDNTLWTCQSCDSDGDCGLATENRTLSIDTTNPSINITYPDGTENYGSIGDDETLNWTTSDINLDTCWYNYNGTNITVTCSDNTTTFTLEEDNLDITIYANDTLGNLNSEYIEWNYKILKLNLTYNEEVLDLSLEDFILNIQASEEITASKLYYDGNIYDSSILSLGSGLYKISNSIQIPDVAVDTNNPFYFNITTDSGSYITKSYNQSIFVLLIDNCDSYTNEVFNISLYDEKTLELLYGTIEANLELFNNDKSTALTNAVSNFYNMSNMRICSNVNLTGTGYYYDLELRYFVDPTNTSTFLYVPEFYHIQKASVLNFPQSIDLFNLNVNESTEFTMYYRDDNYVSRENVLLQIERKYISEGIFRTVEIPITSSEGSAIGHFDLNNYKYKIIATLNGEILNVFDNPAIVCESELSGLCSLTLNGQGSPSPFEDYNTINDVSFDISFNDTDIVVDYVIPSGETRQVNVYMYQVSPFTDDKTLCNSTLTSSAGSFICHPNATIGDSNVFIEIRVDGELQIGNKIYIQEDLGDYFNLNNYGIGALFLILTITMMVSSPIIMVITSVFSVVLLGFLFLLKGTSIGLVLGSFSWLIVAGIIILIKLNKKDET